MTSAQTESPTEPGYRVLLIGIDDYRKRPLAGCVNDIDRVQGLLLDQLRVPVDRIRRLASPRKDAKHSTKVPEQVATLDNIRGELAALARDAQPGERVFIYYSGHGLRAPFERADGRTFHRESLVPVDVDLAPERRVLADYELNGLLQQLAARTPSVTLVLDCCHSAGVSRSPPLPSLQPRSLDVRQDLGWTQPLRAHDAIELPSRRVRGEADPGERSVDSCHVVAACLNHELASEHLTDDGSYHGLLSTALVQALSSVPQDELRTVPWTRIWQTVCATVKAHNPWQNPWMSGNPGRAVLAGPPVDGDPGVPIRRVGAGYELDAGTLALVSKGARIAVYGEAPRVFPPLGSPVDTAARCGLVRVVEAGVSSATAVAEREPFALPPGARARIIEAGEPARLRCAILPDDAVLAAALRASPLVTVVDERDAQVRLEQVDGRWLLTDDKHESTVATALVAMLPAELPRIRDLLEHYYRYALPLRMAEAAKDLPGKLQLRVLRCDHALSPEAAQEADLSDAGTIIPGGAGVCFRVRNTSSEELRVTLLNSAASGKVQLLGDQVIASYSSHVFWAGSSLGQPFVMTLPTGRRQCIDRLTAIGTTALSKDLGYLKVDQKFADSLAIRRGNVRDPARDIDGGDDARNNPPVERWTSASAVLKTRAM